MPIRCVIFDCDGTLVDSETLGNEVMVEIATEHGIEITLEEAIELFTGSKLVDCIAELERRGGCSLPETFSLDFRSRSADLFRQRLQPMPDVHSMLDQLHLPRCVATSGPRGKTELSLSVTRLDHYFDGRIFSSYDIGSWKPEPDIFLTAASQMGFHPDECLVVEDSHHGIAAGIRAGMRVAAYNRFDIDHENVHPINGHLHLIPLLKTLS